jgi:peptidoglycan hydrolase CwlO-like protein
MKIIRRILGVLVMAAGLLGLLLSLAGLVGVWTVKPTVAGYVDSTISTLVSSIQTSQKVMEVTAQALGATVDSVDALSSMLGTTAATLEDTKPVLDQVQSIMGETVPSSLDSAITSLQTAQQAAAVMDSAVKSLENFQAVLSATPLLGAFVEQPATAYDPKVPLADSLGALAKNLEELPTKFSEVSTKLDDADSNLNAIQENLTTMAGSVALISKSLKEYEGMIGQSKESVGNLVVMLTNIQNNLNRILNAAAVAFSLFFLWLLAAQVVIFSQGWELFQGTAGRIEASPKAETTETV